MRKFFWELMFVFSSIALIALISCNSTPTVPVPPPEMTYISISSPDQNGQVSVVGNPNAAGSDDVIIVYNETAGSGVIEDAANDGSFSINISASTGDVIVIQIKRDNRLSVEEELVVPGP